MVRGRSQQLRRLKVKQSVDPIEEDDLINLKAWSQRDPYVKKNDREGAAPPLRKLAVTDLLAGLSAESRPEDQTKAVAGIADSLPMSPSSPSTTRHEPVSSPS